MGHQSLDAVTIKESIEAILHYKRKILRSLEADDQDVLLRCLEKIDKVVVNVSVLQETSVGRVINDLRKHGNAKIAAAAKEIVCTWREIVTQEEEEAEEEECAESKAVNGEKSKHSSSSKKEDTNGSSDARREPSRKRKFSEDFEENKKEKRKEQNRGTERKDKDRPKPDSHKNTDRDDSSRSGVKESEKDKKHKHRHSSASSAKDSEREKKHKDRDYSSSSTKESDKAKKGSKSHKYKSKGGESMGFEDALLAVSKEVSSNKKSKSKEFDSKNGSKGHSSKGFAPPQPPPLPPLFDVPCDISPNYVPQKRPLPNVNTSRHNPANGKFQDESLSALISMSRNSKRTAVYSGSKRSAFSDVVPTLFELCIHVLQEHVDEIAECGGLPFHVLEPVLERAKPETLLTIEEYNPYLVEDTGGLWERICRREFPREQRQEFESWREVYDRCLTERQQKLDLLAVKVQQSYKNVQTTSRKAKLAYVDSVVKPPRDVQRAQDKNGTAPTQSVREAVKKMGGPPRPRGEGRMRGEGFQATAKAKKSPMMLKSLKLMQGIKTNFRK